jgi:UDP-N-acetylmuramate dehydrogenase
MTDLLKQYSYYATGGTCDHLYLPASIEEAQEAVREILRSGSPYYILGGGSNSLVWDDHYNGSVINLSKMRGMRVAKHAIICEAGVENSALAEMALLHSLAGAGWMNRLPGQLGGTTRMNARCYGGEISQIAQKITCVDKAANVVRYTETSVFRGYKNTLFMENGDLIVAVEIELLKGDAAEIKKQMDFCKTDRESKDQFIYPSCGCVFKNDYSIGIPSGLLLDIAGVRGLNNGSCEVSAKHCNFVYNKGATSREILNLTFAMQDKVWNHFGVWLEFEMEILGNLPPEINERFLEKRKHQPKEPLLQPLRTKFAGVRNP